MSRFVWVVCALASASLASGAVAQAPTAPGPAPKPPAMAAAPAPAKPLAAKPLAAKPLAAKPAGPSKPVAALGQPNCTRLPLSDIQFTEEKTIEVARLRLGEYAQKVATQRGWKGFRKSEETVSCEVYLWLGPLGTEYKCLVTATFCPGPGGASSVTSAAKAAPPASAGTAPTAVAAKPSAAAITSAPPTASIKPVAPPKATP